MMTKEEILKQLVSFGWTPVYEKHHIVKLEQWEGKTLVTSLSLINATGLVYILEVGMSLLELCLITQLFEIENKEYHERG